MRLLAFKRPETVKIMLRSSTTVLCVCLLVSMAILDARSSLILMFAGACLGRSVSNCVGTTSPLCSLNLGYLLCVLIANMFVYTLFLLMPLMLDAKSLMIPGGSSLNTPLNLFA